MGRQHETECDGQAEEISQENSEDEENNGECTGAKQDAFLSAGQPGKNKFSDEPEDNRQAEKQTAPSGNFENDADGPRDLQ